jgi:hypothetical protein
MPATIDLARAGRRSTAGASWLPARVPDPPLIENAPTLQIAAERAAAVEGFTLSEAASLEDRCKLYETALPLLAKLGRDDARHMRVAVNLRSCSDLLNSLAVSGSTIRRRCAQEADELARELAAELVKRPGNLREAVHYLLSHPPNESV